MKSYSFTHTGNIAHKVSESDKKYQSIRELDAERIAKLERAERNRVELAKLGMDEDDILFA